MADEDNKAESTEESSTPSKGGGLKLIIIIAVIMIVEGAGVFFLVSSMGGPKGADATELAELEGTGEDAPVEIPLVEERFQNMSTGHVWEWRVKIVLRARQKNQTHIETIQERDTALLTEGVSLIFRRAQDRHLREPGLETITRQLTTYVNEVFGLDADGMPRVDRVIIPECKGFRADN
jgi:flagellar basal body-associated protein FliL